MSRTKSGAIYRRCLAKLKTAYRNARSARVHYLAAGGSAGSLALNRRPAGLVGIPGLFEYRGGTKPCVYFLVLSGNVQYVGQTTCLESRLRTHRRLITHDRAFYVHVDQEDLDCVEAGFIRMFKPPFNRSPGKCSSIHEDTAEVYGVRFVDFSDQDIIQAQNGPADELTHCPSENLGGV